MVSNEMPNRGRSKLTLTEPLLTTIDCGGFKGIGSIAACNAWIWAAEGAAGLPCDVHTV
jgi:hypothetical protein